MDNDINKNMENQNPEAPIIIIERDDSGQGEETFTTIKPRRRWPWVVGAFVAALLAVALLILGYIYWRYYYNIGVPVSYSPEDNIAKLQEPVKKVRPGVIMKSDSILGVRLNIYELRGLKAEITFEEPDTTDKEVFLYSRCADHTADGKYLGTLVVSGQEYSDDVSRLGYCAMVGNRMVIGISRFEDVKDYVMENEGSLFRQFILVSDGVISPRFYLHGKVERRGLGRIGDKLYYIEAPYPETMWDFADAIREYGFIDAIYITGGDDYSFYRTSNGKRHDIGDISKHPHEKWKGIIPWLVFKKNDFASPQK